jgi:FAS-associated factor 2
VARHENLHESLHASRASSHQRGRRNRTEPAPRVVAPRPNAAYRPPLLLAFLFFPLSVAYKGFNSIFRLFRYTMTFLPATIRPRLITGGIATGFRTARGRRMLMPEDTAARFKREFEEEYGENELPWFQGGFAQAQDLAKKELKFLLFVLMSPEHDDMESFVRDTLLSGEVVDFLKQSSGEIVLWGGNVLDSEAFQVSQEYNCTKFPFTGLVCLTPKEGSTRMGTVKRLAGPMPPATYLGEMRSAMEKYRADLSRVRAERTARDAARNIRSEQDSAYERSLALDRERARKRREEKAEAEEAERRAAHEAEEAARLEEKRQQWRQWRAATVATEPDASAKDVVRIALMMPAASGVGRIVRRFPAKTTMEELYAFIECYDELGPGSNNDEGSAPPASEPKDYKHEYAFQVASVMPRQVYGPSATVTMGEKIGRSGNLVVEDVEDDDAD